jgi:hypothetical protein
VRAGRWLGGWIFVAMGCGRTPPPTVEAEPTSAETDADADTDTDADPSTSPGTTPTGTTSTSPGTSTTGTTGTGSGAGVALLHELLADPDPITGDANCDGAVDTVDDEFVEIVNIGSGPLDLSGYVLEDANGLRHSFPAGSVVAPAGALVVYAGGVPVWDGSGSGLLCGARPPESVAQVASTGGLGLNNDGDTVTLRDPAGVEVGSVAYGPEGGGNQSLQRSPELDPLGSWVLHSSVAGAVGPWSPGLRADGGAFSEPPDTGTGGLDTGGTPAPTIVAINEINGDPSLVDGDANCDGTIDSGDDEFVELVNLTGSRLDLTGWTVYDATSLRHTIPAGTALDPGGVLLVFGGGAPAFPGVGTAGWCAALPAGVQIQSASTGLLGFSNGGDTATLLDGAGQVVDAWTFGAEGSADTSLVRDPEPSGATFVQHGTAAGANRAVSPGTRRDGTPL